MTRILRCLTALAVLIPLAAHADGERYPMHGDFDRCARRALEVANTFSSGRIRMDLMINKTGQVYAAFVHSDLGVEDARLERCLTNRALLWKIQAPPVDYIRGYTISFGAPSSVNLNTNYQAGDGSPTSQGAPDVFMPNINDPPDSAPLDLERARNSLDILESATAAEQGTAHLAVRQIKEAIPFFRQALDQDPNDQVALRGLAEALAEDPGAITEARELANRAVRLEPNSAANQKARLTVCLAAKDDACAVDAWLLAWKAPDHGARGEPLLALKTAAEKAAKRADANAQAATQVADDGCGKLSGAQQKVCRLELCVGKGSEEYASQLSKGQATYRAGNWKETPLDHGRILVTRPIEAAAAPLHSAHWMVRESEVRALDPDAREVSLHHSRCAARAIEGAQAANPAAPSAAQASAR